MLCWLLLGSPQWTLGAVYTLVMVVLLLVVVVVLEFASGPGVVIVLSLQAGLQMSDMRLVLPAAQSAVDARPVAGAERRIAPQAGHEQREEGQAQPALAAAGFTGTAIARMLGRLALGIAHTVVDHAAGAAHPRDALIAAAERIRSVFAGTAPIKVLAVQLMAVAAAQARLLLQDVRHVRLVQWFSAATNATGSSSASRHRLCRCHGLGRLQSVSLLQCADRLPSSVEYLCPHWLIHHRVVVVVMDCCQGHVRVVLTGRYLGGGRWRGSCRCGRGVWWRCGGRCFVRGYVVNGRRGQLLRVGVAVPVADALCKKKITLSFLEVCPKITYCDFSRCPRGLNGFFVNSRSPQVSPGSWIHHLRQPNHIWSAGDI